MTLQYVQMPIYEDAIYTYRIALEGNSYTFNAYYNERAEGWLFDLLEEGGVPVVLGVRLVPNYPMLIDYNLTNLSGYMWLEPIGNSVERIRTDPFLLSKYFRLFYIFDGE